MADVIRIGVVGLGYWGPNLARNVDGLPGAALAWCCDERDDVRERLAATHPATRFTDRMEDLLADDELDAVVLATPVPTHAELAVRVLEAGKHCFVEKPLAQSVEHAERAVAAARAGGRVLMVGHLLEYHPGVRKLKEIADAGELGDIHYIYSNRLNLGQLRAGDEVEVAREVRPPVAEADDADADGGGASRGSGHYSSTARPPDLRVTPRRSSVSGTWAAIASWS
ncbi:MAG: Gfo/Idh/MocA family protein, partial [Thermoleophilia bacterium]